MICSSFFSSLLAYLLITISPCAVIIFCAFSISPFFFSIIDPHFLPIYRFPDVSEKINLLGYYPWPLLLGSHWPTIIGAHFRPSYVGLSISTSFSPALVPPGMTVMGPTFAISFGLFRTASSGPIMYTWGAQIQKRHLAFWPQFLTLICAEMIKQETEKSIKNRSTSASDIIKFSIWGLKMIDLISRDLYWVCRSTCEREGGEIRERDETRNSLEALPNELKLNVSAYKTKERPPISISLSRVSPLSLYRFNTEIDQRKNQRSGREVRW